MPYSRFLLSLVLLLLQWPATAQPGDLLPVFDTIQEAVYTLPEKEAKALVLHMDYARPLILNPEAAKEWSSQTIRSIDLVYTGDASEAFMSKLNRRRLEALSVLLQDKLKDPGISWRLVRQTGFRTHGDAAAMFHGFVIRYRKDRPFKSATPQSFREDVRRLSSKPKDSTIFRSFSRNPQWSLDLVVVDMTSSMSPYYKELVAWLHLKKTKPYTGFALFNDGDNIADNKKTVGSTGGIYTLVPPNLDTLMGLMFRVAHAGGGGDTPENDIEAILKGIKANPAAKEVILIADNHADMRDYVLMHLVTKPVRVILCGTKTGTLNTQYLDLARLSGGSVHTIEADIKDLAQKHEGDIFSIRGISYEIKGGKVVRK